MLIATGHDGSMDEAVDGIQQERDLIFRSFAGGLFGLLCTVTSGTSYVSRIDSIRLLIETYLVL